MSIDEQTPLLQGHTPHIVFMTKDPSPYEPILSNEDDKCGLSLGELLPYKYDPWWQMLRRTLFGTFWLVYILTVLTASGLSYFRIGTCKILEEGTSINNSTISTIAMPNSLLGTIQSASSTG